MVNKSHIFLLIFQYYFKLGVILVKRIKVLGIALILLLILVTQYCNVDKSCVVATENKKDSISKTLTFDELVSEFAKDNKIPLDKAKIEIIESLAYSSQKNRDDMTYRIISSNIDANSEYKPSLKIYCESSEEKNSSKIVKIIAVGIDREYKGNKKQFYGDIFVCRESPESIYWSINGDFFNDGDTIIRTKIFSNEDYKNSISKSYSLGNGKSHFKYVFEEGRFKLR